jgi:hypothetical protein
MYLHTDREMESLFTSFVSKAALIRLKGTVQVKALSSILADLVTLENKDINSDTAMLVAAKFFHTENIRRHFEYL